jgi:hypothetical protein
LLFCFCKAFAQSKKKEKSRQKCSTKVEATPESKDGKKEPKPYKKVIDSTATQKGLIDIHKINDKYLLKF